MGWQLLGAGDGSNALAEVSRSTLWAQGWDFTQRILLGSSVVGMLLAIVSGLLAYRLFERCDASAVSSESV